MTSHDSQSSAEDLNWAVLIQQRFPSFFSHLLPFLGSILLILNLYFQRKLSLRKRTDRCRASKLSTQPSSASGHTAGITSPTSHRATDLWATRAVPKREEMEKGGEFFMQIYSSNFQCYQVWLLNAIGGRLFSRSWEAWHSLHTLNNADLFIVVKLCQIHACNLKGHQVLGFITYFTCNVPSMHVCTDISLETGRTTHDNCWIKNKENTAAEATRQH